jgi:hypothetical protein
MTEGETFTTFLFSGEQVDLCPGGHLRKLTKIDVEEYIRLIVKVRLGEFEKMMRYVREGVEYVIPLEICNLMSWKMIEERATGTKTIDIEKLKSITNYEVSSVKVYNFRVELQRIGSFHSDFLEST